MAKIVYENKQQRNKKEEEKQKTTPTRDIEESACYQLHCTWIVNEIFKKINCFALTYIINYVNSDLC